MKHTLALFILISPLQGQTETIRVDLKVLTGGALSGLVVDHNDHGLVIVREDTPYVFAWTELEAGSAYAAKRRLLALDRGGDDRLTAEDLFGLGQFALQQGRGDLAGEMFRQVIRLDASYKNKIKDALNRQRSKTGTAYVGLDQAQRADARIAAPCDVDNNAAQSGGSVSSPNGIGSPDRTEPATASLVAGLSSQSRERVLEAYKVFGAKVQELLGKDVSLVESDHFLIWTDWRRNDRDRLVDWCESMYAALAAQFNVDPDEPVFLAKCPMFCWRSKAKFVKFARLFDGYSGADAVGYTRSIEASGHVHVVLLRQGRSDADFDRFVCTLIHEGTHAFLHRLHSSRLIPHWINEGFADLMAERVSGNRCPNGENAELLARQFVRHDWPIQNLLHGSEPIAVHQYPIAHSVVSYLESLGSDQFSRFIKHLKRGRTTVEALALGYDGMTLRQLDDRWRWTVRALDAGSPSDVADRDSH